MIDLESKFEVLEAEVKEINANKETLKRNLLDLIELQHILQKTQTFFMEVATCTRVFVYERGGRGGERENALYVQICGVFNGNNGGVYAAPYNATCSHMTFMNACTVFIVVHIICVACELHHPF